jgi:GNAT superfamily N-acetyltransferase
VTPDVETRPVWPDDVADLASLFGSQRSTRRCWCTAFCVSGSRFALGWLNGGNRRAFEALAEGSATPMGLLASVGGEAVGWCACGPRARYTSAIGGRSSLLTTRLRSEDDSVWLLACLFVDPGHRGEGLPAVLVRAAVELARREGASAIEGWPSTQPDPADAFLGREEVFAGLGFECVARPVPGRVIMRLELAG